MAGGYRFASDGPAIVVRGLASEELQMEMEGLMFVSDLGAADARVRSGRALVRVGRAVGSRMWGGGLSFAPVEPWMSA